MGKRCGFPVCVLSCSLRIHLDKNLHPENTRTYLTASLIKVGEKGGGRSVVTIKVS